MSVSPTPLFSIALRSHVYSMDALARFTNLMLGAGGATSKTSCKCTYVKLWRRGTSPHTHNAQKPKQTRGFNAHGPCAPTTQRCLEHTLEQLTLHAHVPQASDNKHVSHVAGVCYVVGSRNGNTQPVEGPHRIPVLHSACSIMDTDVKFTRRHYSSAVTYVM